MYRSDRLASVVTKAPKRPGAPLALKLGQGADEAGLVVNRVDPGEVRLDRLEAQPVGAVLVHEAGEEVADLAGLGARRCVGLGGGLFDDRTKVGLALFPQLDERAEEGAIGRDLGPRDPAAVDVSEEIILGPHGPVEPAGIDAGTRALSWPPDRLPGPTRCMRQ